MFQTVRIWSDDECFNERVVWLECHGIHPKCWSEGNLKLIGSLWGKTLRVEHIRYGSKSLTSARILIRTSTLKNIDECVKIRWESGSCDLWVKEMVGYDGKMEGSLTQESSGEEDPCNCFEVEEKVLGNNVNHDKTEEWNIHGGTRHFENVREGEAAVNTVPGVHENNSVENMNVCIHDDSFAAVDDGLVNVSMEAQKSASTNQEGLTQRINSEDLGTDAEEEGLIRVGSFLGSTQRENLDDDRYCFGDNNTTIESRGVEKSFDRRNEGPFNSIESGETEQQYVDNETKLDFVENGNKQLFLEDQLVLALTDTVCVGEKFDPIATIEFPASLQSSGNIHESGRSLPTPGTNLRQNSVPQKRPRGRPKRTVHSLPEPLCVPSTPTNCNQEAIETWNTAKLLGIKTNDEVTVLSALRKSKRLLILEGNNTTA
ncbi:unnamed protein product [Amaranthus hypochondriacus]